MARRRQQKVEVKRVEMSSSASSRPILVPEAHVERYQLNGWTLVAKPKRAAKPAKADDETGGE